MKSSSEVSTFIRWLKDGLLKNPGKFNDQYQQGYYNGLETVAAYMEERPELLRSINKEVGTRDKDQHPEYFI